MHHRQRKGREPAQGPGIGVQSVQIIIRCQERPSASASNGTVIYKWWCTGLMSLLSQGNMRAREMHRTSPPLMCVLNQLLHAANCARARAPNLEVERAIDSILLRSEDGGQMLRHLGSPGCPTRLPQGAERQWWLPKPPLMQRCQADSVRCCAARPPSSRGLLQLL